MFFFLIPFHVDVPMARIPFANWILMAVTVGASVFLMGRQYDKERGEGEERLRGHVSNIEMKLRSDHDLTEDEKEELSDELDFVFEPGTLRRDRFSVSQLFTYVFVHGGPLHLIGNMIFLFVFGNAINAKLGHWPFLGFYFILGAVAGAAWLVFDRAGYGLVGASGAIMGIVGVFLVLYPRNDVRVGYFFLFIRFLRIGVWEVSSYWIIIFYMLQDLVGTLLAGGGGGVAYTCHLVGAGCGIAATAALVRIGLVKSDLGEQNLLEIFGWAPQRRKRRRKIKRRRVRQAEQGAGVEATADKEAPLPLLELATPEQATDPPAAPHADTKLFLCPQCRRKLRVPTKLAGKKIRCKGCGAVMVV
jgi:membrane associated rhomboid family serine protease